MILDTINSIDQQEQAALILQRAVRKHWARQGHVFTSKSLDTIAQIAKRSLTEVCLATIMNEEFLPVDDQPIGVWRHPDSQAFEGFYRMAEKKESFIGELETQKLAKALGITSALPVGRVEGISLTIEDIWVCMRKTLAATGDAADPLFQIINSSSYSECCSMVKQLPESLKAAWRKNDGFGKSLHDRWRSKFFIRAMLLTESHDTVTVHTYNFITRSTLKGTAPNLNKIPEVRKDALKKTYGIDQLTPDNLRFNLLNSIATALWKLPIARREKFLELISFTSFEHLMALNLFLGLPGITPDNLAYHITPSGKIHLSLFDAKLKVYPRRVSNGAEQNCLTSFPQVKQPISKSFREQIKHWPTTSVLVGDLSLSAEQKKLLQERIDTFIDLIEKNTVLTWEEAILEIQPDWIKRKLTLNHIRMQFRLAHEPQSRPEEALVDLLHTQPHSRRRTPWNQFNAYKAEVKSVVERLMPRVIKIITAFGKLDPKRKPFIDEEDKVNDRKFIGYNCCGPTSSVLASLLIANGIPAAVTGSNLRDHAFVSIKTPAGIDLYIDPTYKQLFFRSDRQAELYWHQLEPFLIGSAKEFKAFFAIHKTIPAPFTTHHWFVDNKQKFSDDWFEVFRRLLLDPEYFKRHQKTHQLVHLLKDTMSKEEMDLFKKQPLAWNGTLEPMTGSQPKMPILDFIENYLEPYLLRILKYGLPTLVQDGQWDQKNATAILGLTGAILHSNGYAVHLRGSFDSLEYFPHLAVKETNGNDLVVVPFSEKILKLFSSCFEKGDQLPELSRIFIGRKGELESLIQSLLGNKAASLFPGGFRLDGREFNEDYAIRDILEAINNPLYRTDATSSTKKVVFSIVRESCREGFIP